MKDFLPFHGDYFITLIRVLGVTIIAAMINHTMYHDEGLIIVFITEIYALLESSFYVSNKSTGGKSKLKDLKAFLGLVGIMIMTIIIWVKALDLTHITKW